MISLEAFSGTPFDLRPSLIPSRRPSGVGIVALGSRNSEIGKSDLESLGVGLGHPLSWSVTLETRAEIVREGLLGKLWPPPSGPSLVPWR